MLMFKKLFLKFFIISSFVSSVYFSCSAPSPKNKKDNTDNAENKINKESTNTANDVSANLSCEIDGPSSYYTSYNTDHYIPYIWSKNNLEDTPYFFTLKPQNDLFDKIGFGGKDELNIGFSSPLIAGNKEDFYLLGGVNYLDNNMTNIFYNGLVKVSKSSHHEVIYTNSVDFNGVEGKEEIKKRSNGCLNYFEFITKEGETEPYLFGFGGKNDLNYSLSDGFVIDMTKKQHLFFGKEFYDNTGTSVVSDWPSERSSHLCSIKQDINKSRADLYVAGGENENKNYSDLWNIKIEKDGNLKISSRLVLKDQERIKSCTALNDSYFVIYGGISLKTNQKLKDGIIVRLYDDKISYFKIKDTNENLIGCTSSEFSGLTDNIAISNDGDLLLNIGENKLSYIKSIVIDDMFNGSYSQTNQYIAISDIFEGPILNECIGRKIVPFKKELLNKTTVGFLSFGRDDGKYLIFKKEYMKE